MRKVRWLGTGILVAVAACAVRAEQPTPAGGPAAAELKRMSGYWKPESVQFDGSEQLPDAKSRSLLTLVIDGAEYKAYYCTDPKTDTHFRLFTATLNVDPAAHTFEFQVLDGQKKGERRHGIYELADGKLRMCYGPIDKPRPTAFAAPKGSGIFCETWAVEKR